MDDSSQIVQVKRFKIILLVSSLVCLVLLMMAAFEENFEGEWRKHQKRYRDRAMTTATTEHARAAASDMKIGLKQTFLPALDRIDRCVICHVGIDDPAMASASQPIKTHSGNIFAHHPIDQFGCTVCHEGQGRAVSLQAAHGHVEHWHAPLLTGEAVYRSCGKCHYENDLFGAEDDLYARGGNIRPLDEAELQWAVPGEEDPDVRAIFRGKQLVMDSGCLGCHAFRGRGGNLGPDITYVADKIAHDFDFQHIAGEHTVSQWLYEHFRNPQKTSPGTLMPDMEFSDAQARDLTEYMLSLHKKSMPVSHTPIPPRKSGKPASGERLYAIFCNACHGKEGWGRTVRDPSLPPVIDAPRELMTPAINNPDTLAVASDDYFRHIIRHGRSGTKMISWDREGAGLTDGEIDRVVAYIRQWEGNGPPLENIHSARGDASFGKSLYRSRCVGCHGEHGEGGVGVSLRSASLLAIASDEFLRDAIVFGRSNTAMPSWKQLSSDEVSDLLAYLRTWEPDPPDKEKVLRMLSRGKPGRRSLRIGKSLYQSNCAACHGRKGEGMLGPSLNNDAFLSIVDDAYLYHAIVDGRPGTAMPSWKKFTAQDLADLIGYLRSFNRFNRRALQSGMARGDFTRGQDIFEGVCAGCHGKHAEGGTGPQLNNPVFLKSASDAMLREWIRYGKSGTEMRAFLKGAQGVVELSEQKIEDVIAYLRRLEKQPRIVSARPGTGLVHEGEKIYAANCASCHGAHGEGRTGSALSNIEFLQSASDGYLEATIILGRDATEMRPFGRGMQGNVELDADDVRNVVAYIRQWERQPPIQEIPKRYVIAADVGEGSTLYQGHCAGCHGANGNDGWAPTLNNPEFLAAATDGFLQATIARGRAHTPMRPFGKGAGGVAELRTEQINNIVAFLRTWDAAGAVSGRTGNTGGGDMANAALAVPGGRGESTGF